jgi:hypothetical protein
MDIVLRNCLRVPETAFIIDPSRNKGVDGVEKYTKPHAIAAKGRTNLSELSNKTKIRIDRNEKITIKPDQKLSCSFSLTKTKQGIAKIRKRIAVA